jgi:hypothetical protein
MVETGPYLDPSDSPLTSDPNIDPSATPLAAARRELSTDRPKIVVDFQHLTRFTLLPETSDPIIRLISERKGRESARGSASGFWFLLGLSVFLALSVWTILVGQAIKSGPWVMGVVFSHEKVPVHPELAFFEDPFGLFVVLISLAAPYFYAHQCELIGKFVPDCIGNGALDLMSVPTFDGENLSKTEIRRRLRRELAWANRRFQALGSRVVSMVVGVIAVIIGFLVTWLLYTSGIFSSQLLVSQSKVHRTQPLMPHLFYDTWWARITEPDGLGAAFSLLICVMTYFVLKQVSMGVVFVLFLKRARSIRFNMTPRMLTNTDGAHGLRNVRRLGSITFFATMFNVLAVAFTFTFVLPVSRYSAIPYLAVIVVPLLILLYPVLLASRGGFDSKVRWIRKNEDRLPREALSSVWDWNNVPFRVSDVISALLIYLILPAGLLILGTSVRH